MPAAQPSHHGPDPLDGVAETLDRAAAAAMEWLGEHSGEPTAAHATGAAERGYAPLADAPGRYVLEH